MTAKRTSHREAREPQSEAPIAPDPRLVALWKDITAQRYVVIDAATYAALRDPASGLAAVDRAYDPAAIQQARRMNDLLVDDASEESR